MRPQGDVEGEVRLGKRDLRRERGAHRPQPKSEVWVLPFLSSFVFADWRSKRLFSKSAGLTRLKA